MIYDRYVAWGSWFKFKTFVCSFILLFFVIWLVFYYLPIDLFIYICYCVAMCGFNYLSAVCDLKVFHFDFQYALKRQDSKLLQSKDQILPFEDILPVERLAHEHDASLFAYASHSKKRPNNLILGMFFCLMLRGSWRWFSSLFWESSNCVMA